MASKKLRYIDFNPAEYISGVGALLDAETQGVYWMICSLMYANGGPIPNDPGHIGRLVCLSKTRAKGVISKLITMEKIYENGSLLHQKRTENEIETAQKRIESARENGLKGGRPPKENNGLPKGSGLNEKNLTTNHQPPTTNKEGKEGTIVPEKIDTVIVMEPFDLLWEQFPRQRRGNKGKAKSAYLRALKEKRATHDEMMDGLMRYVNSSEVADKYATGGERWFNDDRWANDYATPPKRGSNSQRDEINQAFKDLAKGIQQ